MSMRNSKRMSVANRYRHLDLGAVRVDPSHPGDGLEGEVAVGVEEVRLHDVAVTRALHAHARHN